MKLTYGADFEMFLTIDEKCVPICGLLGGTKDTPLQIPGAPEGYLYQEDGVTAEFNTPVTDTPTAFVDSVRTAMDHARRFVKEKINKRARLLARSAWHFNLEQLTPHPQAMQVGCDPDYQCYFDGRMRDTPNIADWGGLRFAGFHIHVGYDKERLPEWMMALVLDQYLYRNINDYCMDRQTYYPRGIFRPKPYGVEYRALGSAHLDHLPTIEMQLHQLSEFLTARFSETVDRCLAQKDVEADILLGGNGRLTRGGGGGLVRNGARARGLQFLNDAPPLVRGQLG